jgi:protein-S-isoprenylcysteine O-methyltransferase Ste14
MTLRNQLEANGSWLFRYRSYLPIVTIPIFATCLPSLKYLGHSRALNEVWQCLCLLISLSGLLIRVVVVGKAPYGTSGRNTREQVADTLTTTGLYSVVRHPLYLANYLVLIGMALWPHVVWLAALSTAVFALYYERIMLAEEAFLRDRFGPAFEHWALSTPAFIPKWSAWKSSPINFCWRTVAQREYNALLLILSVFFVFDTIAESCIQGRLRVDPVWFALFLAGFVLFATLRTLKKRTQLLHVRGR